MARLPWVLAGLIAAGLIHILVVFAIPVLAGRDAWARLSAAMKPNTLAIADGKTVPRLPFTSPDAATAYCLFDLSKGNLVVKSPMPEAAWSLTLSTRSGENFYLVTGADAKRPQARLLIIPHDRLPEEASTEKTEEGGEQTIIVSPSIPGLSPSARLCAAKASGRRRLRSCARRGARCSSGWSRWLPWPSRTSRHAAAGRAEPAATAAAPTQAAVSVLAIAGPAAGSC